MRGFLIEGVFWRIWSGAMASSGEKRGVRDATAALSAPASPTGFASGSDYTDAGMSFSILTRL